MEKYQKENAVDSPKVDRTDGADGGEIQLKCGPYT